MKRLAISLLSFVFLVCSIVTLTSCGLFKTNSDTAKENLEKLISYMEDKSSDGVKSLFSTNRTADIENFDEDIQDLLNYFNGEFSSHNFDTPAVFEDLHNGEKKKWFTIGADVITTAEKYHLTLYWCDSDDTDSLNVGIWSLYIFNYNDNPLQDYSFYGKQPWGDGVHNGIHIIRPYKYAEMTLNILHSANESFIAALFSQNVKNNDKVYSEKVNELISYYQGPFVESNEKAVESEIVASESGKVIKRYKMNSYEVKTESGNYYIALKYCDKSDNESEIGINSLYVCKAEQVAESPYWGDGLWTDGIHIGISSAAQGFL